MCTRLKITEKWEKIQKMILKVFFGRRTEGFFDFFQDLLARILFRFVEECCCWVLLSQATIWETHYLLN